MVTIVKTTINRNFKILKIIGTASFIATLIVQNYLRTYGFHYTSETKYWLGILPNFLGALGICLALFSTHLIKIKHFKLSKNQSFIASFVIPIVGLTAWEFSRYWQTTHSI